MLVGIRLFAAHFFLLLLLKTDCTNNTCPSEMKVCFFVKKHHNVLKTAFYKNAEKRVFYMQKLVKTPKNRNLMYVSLVLTCAIFFSLVIQHKDEGMIVEPYCERGEVQ